MAQVSLTSEIEDRFRGGGEQIKAKPLACDPQEAYRRARQGEDCANIPWMNPFNRDGVNNLVKTRRDNGFDLTKESDRSEYRKRLIASASSREAAEEMA